MKPPAWDDDVRFWLAVWDSIQCCSIAGMRVAAYIPIERLAYRRLQQLMGQRP